MNGPFVKPDRPRYRLPTWPTLPRTRRVRADESHPAGRPHPMMLAALVRGRMGAPARGAAREQWAPAAEPLPGRVLDRVA